MDNWLAYIGKCNFNGMGCDRIVGSTWDVTDWHGNVLCQATLGSTWPTPRSAYSSTMSQWYCRRGGRDYTGRSGGQGLSILWRETADSKRKHAAL